MRSWKAVGLTLLAVSLVVCAAAWADQLPAHSKAPDFTLTDVNGKTVSLRALKGKVVFLDFWATWCGPCKAALPHTQKVSKRSEAANGKLVVLAVNSGEDKATVKAFMKSKGYTFRVPLDAAGKASEKYGVDGIPAFFVVNKKGYISFSQSGYDENSTDKAIDAALNKALGQ